MAREHILVIEHDPFVAATIQLMLESFGFRATAVHDRPDALQILKMKRRDIDAVVLTATLDSVGAPSLAEQVGKLGLPLVMISGSHRAMNNAAELGLQLLHKPFRREDLQAEVMFALASGVAGRRKANCRAANQQDGKIVGLAGRRINISESPRARQWRMKAEELRAAAGQMKTPQGQRSLRRLANSYDSLADRESPTSKPHGDRGTG
jgi:DNA-binding response OmpR family regulator